MPIDNAGIIVDKNVFAGSVVPSKYSTPAIIILISTDTTIIITATIKGLGSGTDLTVATTTFDSGDLYGSSFIITSYQ
jgi:hypothetical protein